MHDLTLYILSPSRWVGQTAGGDEVNIQDIVERFESVLAEEEAVSANLHTVFQKLKGLE